VVRQVSQSLLRMSSFFKFRMIYFRLMLILIIYRNSYKDCSFGWVLFRHLKEFSTHFHAHKGGRCAPKSFKCAVARALSKCPEYIQGTLLLDHDEMSTYFPEGYRPSQSSSEQQASEGEDGDNDSDFEDKPCTICESPDDAESCLLCDTCDLAMHYTCIGLTCVPSGKWRCPWCTMKKVPSSKQARDHSFRGETNRMIILSVSPLQGTKLLNEFKSTLKGEIFICSNFET
jgi:hypothetical protein